jgi:hypothetical protein
MDAAPPTTVGDWLLAYRSGASPGDLLDNSSRRLAQTPLNPLWLARASEAQLGAQIAALEVRAAAHPDR